MSNQQAKINWLLILQGWAMLWVVIGHAFLGVAGEGPEWENALFHFAYSFHMPLFMLISGYLFYMTRLKPKEGEQLQNSLTSNFFWGGYKQLLFNKLQRLLIPGLCFSFLAMVLKLAFPGEMSRQVQLTGNDIIHMYLYPNDNPMRELWFIAALMWMFILMPIWKIILKNKYTVICTVVFLIVLNHYPLKSGVLSLNSFTQLAVWFFLGIITCRYQVYEKWVNKYAWYCLFWGIVIYISGFYTDRFLTVLGGIGFSFAIASIADKYIPRLFFSFRNYTYQIFLMGIFAQILVKIMYRHIGLPYVVWYIICILAGLYVPVIAAKIVEKINWRPLKICYGLK